MKKLNTILLTSMMAITMGVATIGVTTFKKNTAQVAEAATETPVNGFYTKITDKSDLYDGAKVFLVADNGQALKDIGGNPTFLWTTSDNVSLSEDESIVHFNNAFVTELTVGFDSEHDQYTFFGHYKMYGRYDVAGYFAYDCRGCGRSGDGGIHDGLNDYHSMSVGIGYWKDACGLRNDPNRDESRWTVNFSGGYIIIKNVFSHQILSWTSSYSDRITWGGTDEWSNINLYKSATIENVEVKTQPTKSYVNGYHYTIGDELDLSGLVVTVTLEGGSKVDINYDDHKAMFSHYPYVTGYGNPTDNQVTLSYLGDEGKFYVQLIIDSPNGYYHRERGHLYDPRGSYMFVSNLGGGEYEDDYRALKINEDAVESKQAVLESVTILSGDQINCIQNNCKIEVVLVNGEYYLKSATKYLKSDSSNRIVVSDTPSDPIVVDYDEGNHQPIFKLKSNGKALGRNGGQYFEFNYGCTCSVYKLEYDPSEINSFMDGFKDVVSYCDYDGLLDFYDLHSSEWNAQASIFSALPVSAQIYLHNVTYTHNGEDRGSVEDLIDRYDYIVSKYNATDFMGRKAVGSYQNHYSASMVTFPIANTTDTATIVIVIASVGLLSLGAFVLYLKKRKHE